MTNEHSQNGWDGGMVGGGGGAVISMELCTHMWSWHS